MFSAKSLMFATLGIVIGFYLLDNYMPTNLLGSTTRAVVPVTSGRTTQNNTYTP